MLWLPYFILGYLALGLQIGLGEYIGFHGAAPSFGLLAVVFMALHAPRDVGLLGSFLLGLAQDLLSQHPPGVYAMAYGLTALLAVSTQPAVPREHPFTHVALALAGGLVTAFLLTLHGWVYPPGPRLVQNGVTLPAVRISAALPFLTALYTALLAPVALWVLQRLFRRFSSRPARRAWN